MPTVALRPRGANPYDHVVASALFGAQHEPAAVEVARAEACTCHLRGLPGAPGDSDPPDRSGKLSPAIVQVALEGSAAFLSDADLVAILLGAIVMGEPPVMAACELLERWGGLEGLARLGPAALASQPEDWSDSVHGLHSTRKSSSRSTFLRDGPRSGSGRPGPQVELRKK